MKICFLTDAWTPVWGGGQTHMWEIAQLLVKKHNYQVDIIVPNLLEANGKSYPKEEKYFQGKLRVLRLGSPFVFPNLFGRIQFIIQYSLFIIHSRYDLYHSHSPSTCLGLWIVKALQKGKIAYTIHGAGQKILGGGPINTIASLLNKILFKIPYDLVFSAAKSTLKTIIFSKPIFVIGNGVNMTEFDKEMAKPDPKYFTVVCISRPDPVKGVEILKAAIKIVQKKYPNVRLNLVSGRVRTAKDLKTANLYVLPSLSEGFPIVLLEAMASKLPIIATDVGDCREIITNSKSGLIVEPGNVSEMSLAIIKMLESSKLQAYGENGYRTVKTKFSWAKIASALDKKYRLIL